MFTFSRLLHYLLFVALLLMVASAGCSRTPQTVGDDEAEARRFLESLDLKVVSQVDSSSFRIPSTFDLRWDGYDALQRDVGLDLQPFKGKQAMSYSYLLQNHPLDAQFQDEANIQASVWVVDGNVIGGLTYPVGKNGEPYSGFGYSLKGNTLEEVTGGTWEDFVRQHGNPQKPGIMSAVSLAHSYNSLQELTDVSDLVVEVTVKGIEKEVPKIDSTYYAVHVGNTLKGKAEQDIIVKQVGIQTEEEKSGEIRVWRESPLMNIGDRYILFLKKATEENTYYIAGEYQGKYKIVEGKVYSVDQEKEREAYVNGKVIGEFKEAVQKYVE